MQFCRFILLFSMLPAYSGLGQSNFGNYRIYRNPLLLGTGHAGSANFEYLDNLYYNPAIIPGNFYKVKICKKTNSGKKKKNQKKKKNSKNSKKSKCEMRQRYHSFQFRFPLIDSSFATEEVGGAGEGVERLDAIKKNFGKPLYLRISQGGHYRYENHVFSFLYNAKAYGLASNKLIENATETVDLELYKIGALTYSHAKTFGKYSIGFNSHFINLENAAISSPITDVATIKKLNEIKNTTTSHGIGGDIGILYAFNRSGDNIGLTFSNAGNTTFNEEPLEGDKLYVYNQTIDLSFKTSDRYFGLSNQFYLDLRNLENKKQESRFKFLHLGHKIKLNNHFEFLWGINQGYFTQGIHIRTNGFSMVLARYKEEFGDTAGFRPDERALFQLRYRL